MSRPLNSLCLGCFWSHITAPNLAVRTSEDREKTLEPSMFLSWQGLEPGLGEKMWRGVVSLLFSVWYGYLIQKKASLWWVFSWGKFFNTPFNLIGGVKCALGHQSPLLQPMSWTGGWLRPHNDFLKRHLQVSTNWKGSHYLIIALIFRKRDFSHGIFGDWGYNSKTLSFNILALYFSVIFYSGYWMIYFLPEGTVLKHFLICN